MYVNLGVVEKIQFLKLSVFVIFMFVFLDEGLGFLIKYQYVELGKLYLVVLQLICCCNVFLRMQFLINGNFFFFNFFGDFNLL